MDVGDECAQLLGGGRPLSDAQREICQLAPCVLMDENCNITMADLDSARCIVYSRAHVRGVEVLASRAYKQSRTTKSYWVPATLYGYKPASQVYMARIEFFVKVSVVDELELQSTQEARFAVCSTFPAQRVQGWTGDSIHVPREEVPFTSVVQLADLDIDTAVLKSKRVKCKGKNARIFLSYHHTFPHADPEAQY